MEGEQEVGQTGIFQSLIDKYEQLHKQEQIDDNAFTEMYDEFIQPIQSDESQAIILNYCQSIYNLLINLHFRRTDLKAAEKKLEDFDV